MLIQRNCSHHIHTFALSLLSLLSPLWNGRSYSIHRSNERNCWVDQSINSRYLSTYLESMIQSCDNHVMKSTDPRILRATYLIWSGQFLRNTSILLLLLHPLSSFRQQNSHAWMAAIQPLRCVKQLFAFRCRLACQIVSKAFDELICFKIVAAWERKRLKFWGFFLRIP